MKGDLIMGKFKDELKKIEAFLNEHSEEVIGDRIAKGVPLTKTQQDTYLGKSLKRKLVNNFKK